MPLNLTIPRRQASILRISPYRNIPVGYARLESVIMKNYKQLFSFLRHTKIIFKNYWVVLIPGFIGLLFFGYLFGFSTINPTNDTWITGMSGDMSQHYLGWLYFRESAWHFPHIGHIDNLPLPSGTSIVFLDSIPLFALFFKLFSDILPQTFQYLGIFTATSFMLQGIFSALILTRFTNRHWLILAGSVFFIVSPILIARAFAHTALTAHWLILLAILLLIYFHQRNIRLRHKVAAWSAVTALAVLIHPYFVPIVSVILLLSAIDQHKKIFSTLLYIGVPATTTIVILWMLGGVSGGTSSDATGLGLYSSNLLSFVAPLGYSSLISMNINTLSWEGLGYLGLGMIMVIPVLYAILLKQYSPHSTKKIVTKLRTHITARNILYTTTVVGALIFALGPIIYLGNWPLLDLPLPQSAEKVWSIFRSTGRILWPLYYLLLTCIVVTIIKNPLKLRHPLLGLFILPFLILQVIDITQSPSVLAKKQYVAASMQVHSTDSLNSRLIQSSCDKDKVIVLDDNLEVGAELFHEIPHYLIECTPPINNGYFARPPKESILSFAREQRQTILTRNSSLPTNVLYITRSKEFADEVRNTNKYHLTQLDAYWVITSK